ncbi:MAG: hypothetical protein MI741_11215 [Rhodospirillales bacterium]|nr:hypothetical protein [Rhodospirillales bacterium]
MREETGKLYSELPGDRAVVLLHNFRCAGNTITYVLSEEFGPEAIFRYGALGETVFDFQDFKAAAHDDRYRFFLGHFCFGVHRHIGRPVTYLTNIRDPMERVISHYAVQNKKHGCSVEEWFDFDFDATNGMVKRLCGFGYKEGEFDPFDFVNDRPLPKGFDVDESHLAQALETVDTHGIEIIDQKLLVESLALLRKRLECRPLFSLFKQHFNRFPNKPELADYMGRFEESNQLDQRLYETLHSRIVARIAAEDDSFAEQVLAIKFLDQLVTRPEKHTLGFREFVERLVVATQALLKERRYALIGNLFGIILTKPNLPATFWRNSISLLDQIGQKAIADECRERFQRQFGEPFQF